MPIRAVAVLEREDASIVEPPAIAARDLRGDLAALLKGYPAGLYLLRPDRYVAAHFPLEHSGKVPERIANLIRSTWTGARTEGQVISVSAAR